MKSSNLFDLLHQTFNGRTAGGCLRRITREYSGGSACWNAIPATLFASPDEAIKALQAAAEAKDKAALARNFRPGVPANLQPATQCRTRTMRRNSPPPWRRVAIRCKEGEDKITLEVGTNNWPMPIPLVKADGQWHFDTAAGKEEIINRHIGKDELHAIGVCRAYVAAQRQYASVNPDGRQESNYAQKFKSTPGKKDGLYWAAAENEPASPFGPLVAEAHAEGYVQQQGRGAASVSRLLFQNSDPARRRRRPAGKWIT